MDSSTGGFIVIPVGPISGLAAEPTNSQNAIREKSALNPLRAAIFLAAVEAWWENRSIPEANFRIGGEG